MKNYQDDSFERLNNAVTLSKERKDKMRNHILEATMAKQKKYFYPKFLSAILTLFVIGLSYTLIASITENNGKNEPSQGEIVDYHTPESLPTIEVTDDMFTMEWLDDSMDRGNYELQSDVHGKLVVSTDINPINRGDILYYQINQQHYIGRVIGLAGETVEIRNGQVYIDNKRLISFYGVATSLGLTKEEYFEKVDAEHMNKEVMEEHFNISMEPVMVKEDTVFVLVDMWWRGTDSRELGLIALDKVEGKILGYEDASKDLTLFELTAEETEAYNLFNEDLDLSHLRGLDPISIAKLYIKAGFDKKYDVQYALYTDREAYVQWSAEEDKNIPESHRLTREQIIRSYRNIDKGTFIQTSEYRGYIEFESEIGTMGFQMIKNEDGIWQVGFLPIQ